MNVCPGFLGAGFLEGFLEIVQVDDGGERRSLVGVCFDFFFLLLGVEPCLRYGRFVQSAEFFGGGQFLFDEVSGVVGVVGFCAIFAGELVDDCLSSVLCNLLVRSISKTHWKRHRDG